MNRNRSFMKVVSVFVSAVFIFSFVLSCGGGGGSSGTPPANYGTADQAAGSSQSVTGGVALTSSIGSQAGSALSGMPTKATNKRRKAAANTNAIANLNPRLKTVVDRMSGDLRGPVTGKAMQKLRSFKTLNVAIPSTTFNCSYSGNFILSGSDTSSTGVYNEYTLDVTYNDCQEGTTSSYMAFNGSMHAYSKAMLDGSSWTDNINATNLSLASYSTGSLVYTDVINGTFNSSSTYDNVNNAASGRDSANGSFTMTTGGYVDSFTFSNVSVAWTSTGDYIATDTTEEATMNGTFIYDLSLSGTSVFKFTLSLSNLNDKTTYHYATDSSVDDWLNGTMSISWYPDETNCVPGSITATTAVGTPLHYATESDYWSGNCPISGTITMNNATIVFGTPITVTVGTDAPVPYATCNDLSLAGQCMM